MEGKCALVLQKFWACDVGPKRGHFEINDFENIAVHSSKWWTESSLNQNHQLETEEIWSNMAEGFDFSFNKLIQPYILEKQTKNHKHGK